MRVLFISHYNLLAGANRSMESLVMKFIDNKIDVSVLLPFKGSFFYRLQKKNVNVDTFPFFYEVLYVKPNVKYLSLPLLWIFDLLMFPFLLIRIKVINPDVIYANSSVDAFSIWVAKILRKKHCVHVREFMKEDFGASFLFGRKMKQRYLLKSDKIVCVSNAVANVVFGQIPNNAKVIYNGVRPAALNRSFRQDYKDTLRLGVVGIIDVSKQQHKAIEYLSEINKKYPNVTLHIVGDKNCRYKKHLFELVDRFNLKQKVVFEGFVKDVDDIYGKFDVLLMCSRSEAFGRVTVEAMQRGILVIGNDFGGTSELIEQGVTGFKYRTVTDIMNALDVLLNDREKTYKIVQTARERANKIFSEENYSTAVYNYVLGLN